MHSLRAAFYEMLQTVAGFKWTYIKIGRQGNVKMHSLNPIYWSQFHNDNGFVCVYVCWTFFIAVNEKKNTNSTRSKNKENKWIQGILYSDVRVKANEIHRALFNFCLHRFILYYFCSFSVVTVFTTFFFLSRLLPQWLCCILLGSVWFDSIWLYECKVCAHVTMNCRTWFYI